MTLYMYCVNINKIMHQKVAETDEHTIKYEIIYTDKVSLKIHIHPLKIAQNFAFAIAQNDS